MGDFWTKGSDPWDRLSASPSRIRQAASITSDTSFLGQKLTCCRAETFGRGTVEETGHLPTSIEYKEQLRKMKLSKALLHNWHISQQ